MNNNLVAAKKLPNVRNLFSNYSKEQSEPTW